MSANPTAIPIFEGQDFFVPLFEVKLRGRALEKDVFRDITQVSYQDNIEEVDSFEITINNWDAETCKFKYLDTDLFDPGKELELWMGYFGKEKLRLMIKGQITSLRPSFPAAGQPTLAISGLNVIHKFRTEQVSHAYEKRTDSQIAEEVGQRLGIKVRTAATNETPHKYVLQDNKYDIIFLMERARRVGYDLFVEEKGQDGKSEEPNLYFGPSDNIRRVTYKLEYGKSLVEFKPELTTARQVGEVTVKGWDAVKKKPITQTAKRSDLKTKGVGAKGKQDAIEKAFSARKEIIADRPIHSEDEAKKLAVATLENIAKDMVKGNGSTVGLPDLRAGGVVELKGMGEGGRFNGRYFIVSTTHSISDSGYTTQFECRREEI
jgi:Bacteriophage probable baseplate hub protein